MNIPNQGIIGSLYGFGAEPTPKTKLDEAKRLEDMSPVEIKLERTGLLDREGNITAAAKEIIWEQLGHEYFDELVEAADKLIELDK